jgi:hypothetical protein
LACESCVCAIDSFCCDTEWDSICAEEAGLDCPTECGCTPLGACCVGDACAATTTEADCGVLGGDWTAGESCATFVCGTGGTGICCVATGVPGCPSDPACETCVCAIDPFCCDTSWDSICADEANNICPTECGCGDPGSNCCFANGGLGCDDDVCEACVCAADPFCCATAWDGICAGEASGPPCGNQCPCGGGGDPPPNDNCADALAILCDSQTTVDNSFATTEPGDPLFSCFTGGPAQGSGSVWFTFEATNTSALVSTCNSPGGDTLIGVYEGDCTVGFIELACSEDVCGLLSEVCVENLVVGNTYTIQVASFSAFDQGTIVLDVNCPCPRPCDTCLGDSNGDAIVDGRDGQQFADCYLGLGDDDTCACSDINRDGDVDDDDVQPFVDALLNDTGVCPNACPPGHEGQKPNQVDAFQSNGVVFQSADNFTAAADGVISSARWWGGYLPTPACPNSDDNFTITYFENFNGRPGAVKAGPFVVSATKVLTDALIAGFVPEYVYDATHDPVAVTAGECIWISVVNVPTPPGGSNCCFANGGLGCDDDTCEGCVCGVDPFCCATAWDAICADEAAGVCGASCPCGGGGSTCCFANGGLGCDDPTCQDCVCGVDSFCCDSAWDSICADEAAGVCAESCPCEGGGGPPVVCTWFWSQSSDGNAEAAITNVPPAWPFESRVTFDLAWCLNIDVDLFACPEPTGACCNGVNCTVTPQSGCFSNCCIANGGLGCDDQVCEDCVCAVDSFCCDVAWDGICADEAAGVCGASCPCATLGEWFPDQNCDEFVCPLAQPGACCAGDACINTTAFDCQDGPFFPGEDCDLGFVCPPDSGDCCVAHATTGCVDFTCESCVCDLDPFCCEVSWDGVCVGEAQVQCQPPCVCPIPGVCCQVDVCLDSNSLECADLGGDFFAGAVCATFTCPLTPGACCAGVDCIDGLTFGDCQAIADSDFFPFLTCADVPECPGEVFGACCVSGVCTNEQAAFCAGQHFPGQDCDLGFVCPLNSGNCCTAHGGLGCEDQACQDCVCAVDPFCCATAWDGICQSEATGAPCGPNGPCICPVPGVCCQVDVCTDSDTIQCAAQGGDFFAGANCATFTCPLTPGACCDLDLGGCTDTTAGNCPGLFAPFEACANITCPDCGTQTLTQVPPDDGIVAPFGTSVSCNAGGLTTQNFYARSYPIDADITISCVDFGVETTTGVTLTVNLYRDTDGGAPDSTPGDLVLLDSTTAVVPATAGTIHTAAFFTGAAMLAGETLVVEIDAPDLQGAGGSFWMGCSTNAETAPSYLKAAACAVNAYTTTVAIGFPQSRWILNPRGD